MRILLGVLCAGLFAGRSLGAFTAVELYKLKPPAGWATAEPSFLPASPQVITAGRAVGSGSMNGVPGQFQALLWDTSGAPIQLNPAGAALSEVQGTNGVQQVGVAISDQPRHAYLWNGTAASAVDLNPVGFVESEAVGTSGDQQVGDASPTPSGPAHAMLWTGTASSAADLSPPGSSFSYAMGTDGMHQVGYAASGPYAHATLWTGTAASATDLNPAGVLTSGANADCGSEQVGDGETSIMVPHAFLWHGSAATAVDLNPAGVYSSDAFGTDGMQEVGELTATLNGPPHASLWSGTAASAVDLDLLLPPDIKYSYAYSIDAQENIFGVAADASHNMYAVEWQVPEPASVGLLGLVLLMAGRVRTH